ncbi:MAG: NUDIX domain-containing protein [Proteobacteria bacterium]|nr:NUDIX domain-containing protein [Pseudomonadota bacterium]
MSSQALRRAETAQSPTIIPAIAEDGALFPIEKMAAHRRGLLHQAVSVFVFSGEEMLIQRRATGKYHSGGQWANTCCSHPNWGETVEDAAARRLHEELGFRIALKAAHVITYKAPVGHGLVEHERVQVFYGSADRRTLRIAADPAEVTQTRWIARERLQAEIDSSREDFTPWLRIYLERWDELGF